MGVAYLELCLQKCQHHVGNPRKKKSTHEYKYIHTNCKHHNAYTCTGAFSALLLKPMPGRSIQYN